MRFGLILGNDPTTAAREARVLEEYGFDTAWFPEVPLLGLGDPYVCMALAAQSTDRIRLGTFVAPAGVRPAPMLLTPVGTIGRIAPGRVRLGWGSGAFSRLLAGGMQPLKVAELREELTVLRDLVQSGHATFNGRPIRFYKWNRPSLSLAELSLEVAASGPRTAALAGELGDGLLTSGEIRPAELRALRAAAANAAVAAERPTDFPFTIEVGPLCVVRPGETLDSERVRAITQSRTTSFLGRLLSQGADPDELEPELRETFVRFRAWVHERFGDLKAADDGLRDGFGGRKPEFDQFATPAAINACTLTGYADELADRLREIAQAGVTDVAIAFKLDCGILDADELVDLAALREAV